MRLTFEYTPYSEWFGYWKSNGGIVDELGNHVIWVFRIQISIYFKGNKYYPKKMFTWKETDK